MTIKHRFSILISSVIVFSTSATLAQCNIERAASEIARGTVFLDANQNLTQDAGESGIANVSVSNGCNVVLTNDAGNYEISLAPTEILFVSKPANFTTPVDENNLPQFFYRHYPDGTPNEVAGTSVEWLWPVIEPTGELPDSINFPLFTAESTSSNFLAHGFADTQAHYETGQDMVREELVNPLIGNPYGVQFGLTVGDVVFDNLDLYDRHKAMMGLMEIPQWNLPGNHDMNLESPNAHFANETYKMHFGPTYYSFDYGDVHIVALNNVEYAGEGKEFARGQYRGYLNPIQLSEKLTLSVSVEKIGERSFTLLTRVSGTEEEKAVVTTVHVTIDQQSGVAIPLPEPILQLLNGRG